MRSGELLDSVVRHLRRQLGDAPTDGELLEQFAGSRDEAAVEVHQAIDPDVSSDRIWRVPSDHDPFFCLGIASLVGIVQ